MAHKKINGYTIFMKDLLGKGSYGSVYRGEQDATKRQCAIKVLQKKLIDSDQYLKTAVFSEIHILQSVKSENIVTVFDVMESSHNYYIIQEICDSDLERYIEKHKQITEDQATDLLKQICNGFLALVKEGILHRDLKPANVMLAKGKVKIGDFGFAKKNITKRMKNMSTVGTPLYMSLELLKSEPYTSKCDVWAAGFIYYEMLHGKTPWIANTEFELVKNIQNKSLVISSSLKPVTKDFLSKTLKIHESDRLSWDQVFTHPIFGGYFHQYSQQNEQFQDKLKRVMTELRFRINSNNINLSKLLESLHFNENTDLNYAQFTNFLKYIHPDISKEQVSFFFQKMDEDANGTISIGELAAEMERNHIIINRSTEETSNSSIKKAGSLDQSTEEGKLSNILQQKVRKCFTRLYKILKIKNLTLYKTFDVFDTDKSGELTFQQFQKILRKLDNSFTEDQLQLVFDFIDIDHSKTIEFDEMNLYYCKVNGIPESLDLPAEYYEKKRKDKSK